MKFYMPKSALLFCVSIMITGFAFGQNQDSVNNKGKTVRLRCTYNRVHALAHPPLYVLKLDSKPNKEAIADSSAMKKVKNDWIKNIDILKDRHAAIAKYGEKGKNGVILITLKTDSFKTRKELRNLKFRRI